MDSTRRAAAIGVVAAMSSAVAIGIAPLANAATPVPTAAAVDRASTGRAFERVSPEDKGGFKAEGPLMSEDGNTVSFASSGSFAGQPNAFISSRYLSQRTDNGWTLEALKIPLQGRPPYVADIGPKRWSPDRLSQVVSTPAALTPGAPDYTIDGPYESETYLNGNLYRRDRDGTFTLLSGTESQIPEDERLSYRPFVMGGTRDLSRIVFKGNAGLAGAPPGAATPGGNLFSTSNGRDIENVGVLPNGTPSPTGATLAGEPVQSTAQLQTERSTAVSADGSRVYFRTDADTPGVPQLYLREGIGTGAARTLLVSRSRRLAPEPASDVEFRAASQDGTKVLFTSLAPLTDDAGTGDIAAQPQRTGDLYLYDAATDELKDLTPGNSGLDRFYGAAKDLSSAYFVSSDALAPGATAGGSNLYRWTPSKVTFIAEVGTDGSVDSNYVRVTGDGEALAFASSRRLTDSDNTDPQTGASHTMLYLYDAKRDTISCASCRSDGSAATANVVLVGDSRNPTSNPEGSRVLSADGRRLFFGTVDDLTPGAANRRVKIYEYDGVDNTVQMISTGSSDEDDVLVDASADGSSVTFTSTQQLVADDDDDLADAYVSRIGGGFSAAAEPEQACSGDTCNGTPSQQRPVPPAGSAAAGSGNVVPPGSPPVARPTLSVATPRATRSSRTTLRVSVSGRGALSVSGAGVRAAKRGTTKRATYTVTVRLSSRAARTLQKRGRLTTRVKVSFTPAAGKTIRKTVTVRFLRPPAKSRTALINSGFEGQVR